WTGATAAPYCVLITARLFWEISTCPMSIGFTSTRLLQQSVDIERWRGYPTVGCGRRYKNLHYLASVAAAVHTSPNQKRPIFHPGKRGKRGGSALPCRSFNSATLSRPPSMA